MNLVVCFKEKPVEEPLIDRMRMAWPKVEIINVGQKDIAAALLDADFFCGHAKVPVDWDAVARKGRLQWIQSSAAGMDWCLVPSVIESDIVISTASGVLADQVAEHTMALILAWMRNLTTFFQEQRGPCSPDYRKFIRRPTRDLTGKTVGIVGFGGVGRRLAQVLAPFQVRILATDLLPTGKTKHVAELWPPERLDDLLGESDVVILCLPLNRLTRGLFDADRLKKMRPDTLLVNVARGPLIDTDALVAALDNKELAGAVVDVTSPEPLPEEHPLWNLPNVIITPHVAGQSHYRFDDVVDIFVANVHRWCDRQPLINFLTPEGKRLGFPLRSPDYPLWIDVRDVIRDTQANTNPQSRSTL